MEAKTKKKFNKDAEPKFIRLTQKGLIKGEVDCDHDEKDCNDYCIYGMCEWNKKALRKLKEYEDLGYTPDQLKKEIEDWKDLKSCMDIEGDGYSGLQQLNDLIELQRYRKLKEEGKLIRVTLVPGDVVYCVSENAKTIDESTILTIYYVNGFEYDSDELYFVQSDIGKTVFLTKEEAEKKLEELEKQHES